MLNVNWTFFQEFLNSPRTVAAVMPSSPFLARSVIQAAGIESARIVIELGAGTGDMTRAMLQSLPDNARLLSIERTDGFIPKLRRIDDQRLTVVHGCASSIAGQIESFGLDAPDAVVSGIPFSMLPPALSRDIVDRVYATLRPGGRFVAYQCTDKVAHYTRPVMGEPDVRIEYRNLPPHRIFRWQKPPAP